MSEMVKTVAEANAQRFRVLEYKGWFAFAHLLNGYEVADELGFELGDFSNERAERYFQTGAWEGTLLELRLVLFFEARALRFSGMPGYDPNDSPDYRERIQDLLEAIRQKGAAEGKLSAAP